MSDYFIGGTFETLTIDFKASQGNLVISGRSIPENSIEFFGPFMDALNNYIENPQDKTEVSFHLEYFNTSSSKCILDILRLLQQIHTDSTSVNINWYFDQDDDEIQEIGQDYSHIISVPFNIKEATD